MTTWSTVFRCARYQHQPLYETFVHASIIMYESLSHFFLWFPMRFNVWTTLHNSSVMFQLHIAVRAQAKGRRNRINNHTIFPYRNRKRSVRLLPGVSQYPCITTISSCFRYIRQAATQMPIAYRLASWFLIGWDRGTWCARLRESREDRPDGNNYSVSWEIMNKVCITSNSDQYGAWCPKIMLSEYL